MADFAPVTAFMAAEPLLVREAVAQLKAQVLGQGNAFNSDEVDLATGDVGPLIDAAKMLPMMARYRWVHGYNLNKLPAREHKDLIAYIQAPITTTVLVLSGEPPDGRLKLTQTLRKAQALKVLETPKSQALPGWVRQRALKEGLSLSTPACAAIIERTGESLGALSQIVATLVTYAGSEKSLDVHDIEAIVALTRDANIFQLVDALSQRKWESSALQLNRLLEDGTEPLSILALIARQMRLLLGAKTYRGPASGLHLALGVPPFVASRIKQSEGLFTAEHLSLCLRRATQIDISLKQQRQANRAVLHAFLLEICGVKNTPSK